MDFIGDSVYHVYNRGNNQQTIFYTEENYLFFLYKFRKEICSYADIIAYCLMPNHFHLMLKPKASNQNSKHPLSRKIGTLLSSYTRAINIQENKTGSLFQQKTKAIEVYSFNDINDQTDYLSTCFHYIHQNPLKAGLVTKLEDWEFSSFMDYANIRKGSLINKQLAKELIEIDWDNFYDESYGVIDESILKSII